MLFAQKQARVKIIQLPKSGDPFLVTDLLEYLQPFSEDRLTQ